MASTQRIGIRQVKALPPNTIFWDGGLPGFGIRRQKGETVTYVLLYRNSQGRQRWFTIGHHGAPWTPEMARKKAMQLLGEVADGADPSGNKITNRAALTIADLCDEYLAAATKGQLLKSSGTAKKASTLEIDKGRIERHIKPLIGRMLISAVTPDDVDRLLHDIAAGKSAARVKTKPRGLAVVTGGKAAANRTTGLLGAIFSYAVRRRLVLHNPVRGLRRFADVKKERRLSPEEFARLGKALSDARQDKIIWPPAVSAAMFLALTGWRKGEVLGLTWLEVDRVRRTARLGDTKTGVSVRPLSSLACEILDQQPKSMDCGVVFPSVSGLPMAGFRRSWAAISRSAELPAEVTPHVLRHSYASMGADLGFTEITIAALIGHRMGGTTSRYTHHADKVLLTAADQVARAIAAAMNLFGENLAGNKIIHLQANA